MSSAQKIIQAAAGNAGAGAGEGLYVEEVFSTYLYPGNGSTQTITNGIDLDGEGGMVWIKCRSLTFDHKIYDTERGVYYDLESNTDLDQFQNLDAVTSFNSNGFSIDDDLSINNSDDNFVSWTFRKAPKFFDVVTYTGDGVAGREIAHNLGCAVGAMFIKRTDASKYWPVYHRSIGATNFLRLNENLAAQDSTIPFGDVEPTSTVFTVSGDDVVNGSGATYVAYLFAHNNGDGEFGENADQDIIKCGSYTGNGNADGPEIDLGFEPQWLLIKRASGGTGDWYLSDTMRGIPTDNDPALLRAHSNAAEDAQFDSHDVTSTGFKLKTAANAFNGNGFTYIYIAIRRGPMKTPEDATEVFGLDRYASGGGDGPVSGFVTDAALLGQPAGDKNYFGSRLTGNQYMRTYETSAEATQSNLIWDRMDGAWNSGVTGYMLWGFRRAPGFFDVVTYEGTGSATTVSHNLGVAPELLISRTRSSVGNWRVFHKDFTEAEYLTLDATSAKASYDVGGGNTFWGGLPTDSTFSVNLQNASGVTYIAYLFATLPGVSKVGSYTGNGTSQTIDCGFSTGARFVLIKRTNTTGNWNLWDSERGIVSGNDPRLELNTSDNEDTGHDYIDPDSSGFVVNYVADDDDDSNVSGDEYIFLAIA